MNSNRIILIRHSYDDHSYIDGKNDTSLTANGIEIAKEAAIRIVPTINKENVIIRYSSKQRAKETAIILSEELEKKGFNYNCLEDKDLTELYQGKLNFGDMVHKDRVDFLQSCWDDFENCRKNGNLNHHFGELKSKQIVERPGECHKEWSARIATGIQHILTDIENENTESITITHRGAILLMQNLFKIINNLENFENVEKYETIWMDYCKDFSIQINNTEHAKTRINNFIKKRR